jgi:hypothetical protein
MANNTFPPPTSTAAVPTPDTWSGREVAYFLRGSTETDRAAFAAWLVIGELQVAKFTEQAAARLCGVSVFRLRKALGKASNGHKSKPALGDLLAAASPTELAAAAAQLGCATIWDTMITPLLDREQANQAAR